MGENEKLIKDSQIKEIGNYRTVLILDKTARQITGFKGGDKVRIEAESGKITITKLEV